MKSYSSREVIQMLEANGWILTRVKGSHHHYSHPTKKGLLLSNILKRISPLQHYEVSQNSPACHSE